MKHNFVSLFQKYEANYCKPPLPVGGGMGKNLGGAQPNGKPPGGGGGIEFDMRGRGVPLCRRASEPSCCRAASGN